MARLLPAERLRKRLDTYFSQTELAAIVAKARQAGLPTATFVRNAALEINVAQIPSGNSMHWRELGRVGSNLNQLTRAINSGVASGIDAALIDQLAEQVRLLRLDLTGGSN